ncbi:unnamed protein product [Closterium sp. NIES-53]
MQRSSQGYTFSLGSGSVSWRSTHSSSVLSSSCEAEIYAAAMAAQELRWLTYLLTDLGEQPRSPPQCGQLRLAYMATRANTADVFTKALPPGDHQRFATVLGLLALPFLTGLVTTCSPPLCLWGVSTCTQLIASSFILLRYFDRKEQRRYDGYDEEIGLSSGHVAEGSHSRICVYQRG